MKNVNRYLMINSGQTHVDGYPGNLTSVPANGYLLWQVAPAALDRPGHPPILA